MAMCIVSQGQGDLAFLYVSRSWRITAYVIVNIYDIKIKLTVDPLYESYKRSDTTSRKVIDKAFESLVGLPN